MTVEVSDRSFEKTKTKLEGPKADAYIKTRFGR